MEKVKLQFKGVELALKNGIPQAGKLAEVAAIGRESMLDQHILMACNAYILTDLMGLRFNSWCVNGMRCLGPCNLNKLETWLSFCKDVTMT